MRPPAVPAADAPEHRDRDDGRDSEPGEAALPARQHDERREQRTERRAGVAADLEQRLREAVLPARRQPRDPRRLGMEDRRADADERRRREHGAEVPGPREQQQPGQREPMPTASEYGFGRRSV